MYLYLSYPSFLGIGKQICVCLPVPDGSNAIEINWLTIDVTISYRKKVKPKFDFVLVFACFACIILHAIEINWPTIDGTISYRNQVKPGFFSKRKIGRRKNWITINQFLQDASKTRTLVKAKNKNSFVIFFPRGRFSWVGQSKLHKLNFSWMKITLFSLI